MSWAEDKTQIKGGNMPRGVYDRSKKVSKKTAAKKTSPKAAKKVSKKKGGK